ncbi:MAG: hypothetical protein HOD92_22235, partial [Deltaproteobacteria bacterium]|nr:hypothetical protein [Deltaproteobacteria bacterium]
MEYSYKTKAEECLKSTVPIYNTFNRYYNIHGSGVLIDAGPLKAIATATHVLEDDQKGLFLPGEKEIFQFTGEVIENKNKIADIGLMILEDAVFYEINKTYKPVDLNNMMINGEGNNEYDEFFVAGYPKAK